MTEAEAREAFDLLASWFESARRTLPWRAPGTSPWGILVSEIMAQQTPVARVASPWISWMERWPRPQDLAEADPAEVLRAWGTLGYPRRALRLQECSRSITANHGGQVPSQLDELKALPGIGDYTAAAVASFAYGRRTVVLDTNIRRVIGRAFAGRALPTAHLTRSERASAEALIPRNPRDSVVWNEGLMELGALVCTARSPRCSECPLERMCAWKAAGYPEPTHTIAPKQKFEGTDRQARGRIMKRLRSSSPAQLTDLSSASQVESERFARILAGLLADGLIHRVCDDEYALGPEQRVGHEPGAPA